MIAFFIKDPSDIVDHVVCVLYNNGLFLHGLFTNCTSVLTGSESLTQSSRKHYLGKCLIIRYLTFICGPVSSNHGYGEFAILHISFN